MLNDEWKIPECDKSKILEVLDFVENQVSKELQQATLEVLLSFYLQSETTPSRKKDSTNINAVTLRNRGNEVGPLVDSFLQKPVDWSEYDEIFSRRGGILDKSLLILYFGHEEDCEWLMPGEIARILKEKARVSSVYTPNISNALKDARSFVDRRSRETGYEYRLTLNGEEYVKSLIKKEVKRNG